MALLDFQYELGGVVLGTDTEYPLSEVTGLGLAPKRPKRYQIPGADGVEWGREYRDGNLLTFEGIVTCPGDPAAAWAARRALLEAFSGGTGAGSRFRPRTTVVLSAKWPGQAVVEIPGRPDRCDVSLAQLVLGLIPFTATFEAAGPVDF